MLKQIKAKALKDDARILGLVLSKGAMVEIDITDEQLPLVQAAVDSGDVDVLGMAKTVAPSVTEAKVAKK